MPPAAATGCTDYGNVQPGSGVRVCDDGNGNALPDYARADAGPAYAEYEEDKFCLFSCDRDTYVRAGVDGGDTDFGASLACEGWPPFVLCDDAGASFRHGDQGGAASLDLQYGTLYVLDLAYEDYDYEAYLRFSENYTRVTVDEYGLDGHGRLGDDFYGFEVSEYDGEVEVCRSATVDAAAPATGCDAVRLLP